MEPNVLIAPQLRAGSGEPTCEEEETASVDSPSLKSLGVRWMYFYQAMRSFLEKEMATHSSILVWRNSWTEKPGGLQSRGSQRVRHH